MAGSSRLLVPEVYAQATSRPDCQTKSCQTEPDEKIAGSIWLPGPETAGNLKEVGQIVSDGARYCLPW